MAEIPATSRFVVLRHSARDGVHWDLMLDRGPTLATWRLLRAPHATDPNPIPAQPIGDHRRDYLDFEGPLSGDRGRVDRYDAGTYQAIAVASDCWEIEFRGAQLAGRYSLCASGADVGWPAPAEAGGAASAGASENGLSSASWLLRRLSFPR